MDVTIKPNENSNKLDVTCTYDHDEYSSDIYRKIGYWASKSFDDDDFTVLLHELYHRSNDLDTDEERYDGSTSEVFTMTLDELSALMTASYQVFINLIDDLMDNEIDACLTRANGRK